MPPNIVYNSLRGLVLSWFIFLIATICKLFIPLEDLRKVLFVGGIVSDAMIHAKAKLLEILYSNSYLIKDKIFATVETTTMTFMGSIREVFIVIFLVHIGPGLKEYLPSWLQDMLFLGGGNDVNIGGGIFRDFSQSVDEKMPELEECLDHTVIAEIVSTHPVPHVRTAFSPFTPRSSYDTDDMPSPDYDQFSLDGNNSPCPSPMRVYSRNNSLGFERRHSNNSSSGRNYEHTRSHSLNNVPFSPGRIPSIQHHNQGIADNNSNTLLKRALSNNSDGGSSYNMYPQSGRDNMFGSSSLITQLSRSNTLTSESLLHNNANNLSHKPTASMAMIKPQKAVRSQSENIKKEWVVFDPVFGAIPKETKELWSTRSNRSMTTSNSSSTSTSNHTPLRLLKAVDSENSIYISSAESTPHKTAEQSDSVTDNTVEQQQMLSQQGIAAMLSCRNHSVPPVRFTCGGSKGGSGSASTSTSIRHVTSATQAAKCDVLQNDGGYVSSSSDNSSSCVFSSDTSSRQYLNSPSVKHVNVTQSTSILSSGDNSPNKKVNTNSSQTPPSSKQQQGRNSGNGGGKKKNKSGGSPSHNISSHERAENGETKSISNHSGKPSSAQSTPTTSSKKLSLKFPEMIS